MDAYLSLGAASRTDICTRTFRIRLVYTLDHTFQGGLDENTEARWLGRSGAGVGAGRSSPGDYGGSGLGPAICNAGYRQSLRKGGREDRESRVRVIRELFPAGAEWRAV